jgi:myo-inositol-1(or 4)-monophosphatase
MFQSKAAFADLTDLPNLETTCEAAARLGGAVLMEHFGNTKAWNKGPGDWVSNADIEAERAIRDCLLNVFPDHRFLGEESPPDANHLSGQSSEIIFQWIVDPLDGTINYLHQLRSFCTTVALAMFDPIRNKQQVITGAVFDPILDECYTASIGRGALLNDGPIQVSDCRELEGALTVVSTSSRVQPDDPQVIRMVNVMGTTASMRRMGSAALNLCYLACGRVDAYWATNLSSWDVAAGWLIANEAGAVFESLDSEPLNVMHPKFCCAATPELMDQLRPLLRI